MDVAVTFGNGAGIVMKRALRAPRHHLHHRTAACSAEYLVFGREVDVKPAHLAVGGGSQGRFNDLGLITPGADIAGDASFVIDRNRRANRRSCGLTQRYQRR